MQVYQIIKESANNAAELKSAFNEAEWANIICYFVSEKYRNPNRVIPLDGAAATAIFGRADRLVGKNMPDRTLASEWQTYARQFGMQLPVRNPDWPEIFNHLNPHKGHACEIQVSAAGQQTSGERNPNPQTPETMQEISALMASGNYPNSFTTAEQIQTYMREFLRAIANTERRRTADRAGQTWYQRVMTNAGNNDLARAWQLIYSQYVNAEGAVTTVTRPQLDREIYGWLISADELVARRRAAEQQ